MAGKRVARMSAGVRWAMQCRVTGGIMWMKSEVTLSSEWKTMLFLHMAIATALLP